MNAYEAGRYVDAIIEQLLEWNVISENAFGKITENQKEELADKIAAMSEE